MAPEPYRVAAPGREAQVLGLAGAVAGLIGALFERVQPAAFQLTESTFELGRRALPGLVAVAVGLGIWVLSASAPAPRALALAQRTAICAATVLGALGVDLAIQALRNVAEAGQIGPTRWELPFRLGLAGFALGTVFALLFDLVRRLTTSEAS